MEIIGVTPGSRCDVGLDWEPFRELATREKKVPG